MIATTASDLFQTSNFNPHRQLRELALSSPKTVKVEAGAGSGWFSVRRDYSTPDARDPLSLHADWSGPCKLLNKDGRVEKRYEFFLEAGYGREGDLALEQDLASQYYALLTALYDRAIESNEPRSGSSSGSPDPETLVQWLRVLGHDAVRDEQHNLRLTLNRSGMAGQARVTRGDGRLRFSVGLGRWSELSKPAEKAMRHLARLANNHLRLARIVWSQAEGAGSYCEAQVDLSGMPWGPDPNRAMQHFWQGMVTQAISSLGAAWHQLGVELDVLALPENEELARWLL